MSGLRADVRAPACRETGCLNGVITSDASIPSEKLVEMAKGYNIVGKDLISEVRWSAHLKLSPAAHALCQFGESYDHNQQLSLHAWLQVTCSEPYEWKDPTISEWEFSQKVRSLNGAEPLHVSTAPERGYDQWPSRQLSLACLTLPVA